MSSLAIIPARGGSKRLKKKNIIDFFGAPIISYTITESIRSNCFDRIVISTDDSEIFEIASKYHHDVVLRSIDLSTDKATVDDVCYDFLLSESKNDRNYDFLTVLYATAPMRTSKDIIKVFKKVKNEGFISSMAVTGYSHPVHQALTLSNSKIKRVFPKYFDLREKDAPIYYIDNGSTYSIKVKNFIKTKNMISKNLGVHIMPPERSVDINTEYQLDLAKYYYEKINMKV